MGGTSIGAAIDWLVANVAPAAAQVVPDVIVAESWAEKASRSYITIGRQNDDNGDVVDGEQAVIELGQFRVEETYDLNVWILAIRPQPGMRAARVAALQLYDTVVATVASDRTLGGALQGGRYAELGKLSLSAAAREDPNGSQMRVYAVTLTIHCRNLYDPRSSS